MNLINKITQIAAGGVYETLQQLSSPSDLINHNITTINNLTEYFIPVLTESQFLEKGVMTPDEFVESGDMLSYSCRTWQWYASTGSSTRSYLPADKQFLLTKNVVQRKSSHFFSAETNEVIELDENTSVDAAATVDETASVEAEQTAECISKLIINAEVPDLDDTFFTSDSSVNEVQLKAHSPIVNEAEPSEYFPSNTNFLSTEDPEKYILDTRSYDLSITYDKFYRTPRIWINGYDHKGLPLAPEMILSEISSEHVNKTVTIEQHPYLPIVCVSIHPCHHSTVMKRMIDTYSEVGKTIKVRDYMFLFLKFISSIIPNIDYDLTFSV